MMLWEQTWAYWQSGGVLLLPIACVSFGILFLVLRTSHLMQCRLREGRQAQMVLASQQGPLREDALRAHLSRQGFALILHAALYDIKQGQPPLEAFQARTEQALGLLQRDLVLLGALTASAPLLGLLGTVGGMISTFEAVAFISGNTGSRVAAGISQALITTQFGLVVAMPGVFGYVRLKGLLRHFEVLVSTCRAHAVALLAPPVSGAEGGMV